MKMLRSIGPLLLLVVLSGCAVGNQYDYQSTNVALPVVGSGELGLGVIENRSYVLDGSKKPNFVGLQRATLGNAFQVTTVSGNSLTQDMATSLNSALRDNGFNVTDLEIATADSATIATAVSDGGLDKNVVLTVTEWKTDIYLNMMLHFDLLLEIVNGEGVTIASNSTQGEEKVGGGGFEKHMSETASSAFETKIGRLFNDASIKFAMSE